MCFIKSSGGAPDVSKEQDAVQRQHADASVTKSQNENKQGYAQNLKTSPLGLEEVARTDKKTLLGE